MKTGSASQDRLCSFEARTVIDDGYGNTVSGPFAEIFREMARMDFERGGEGVEAARLEGRETIRLRVRSNENTMAMTTDYRVKDVQTGKYFAVKSIDQWTSRGFVWLRIQSGVAA